MELTKLSKKINKTLKSSLKKIDINNLISAVVLIKNDEVNIKRALKSLFFCEEIIIINDNSADTTLQQIKEFAPKAKIFTRSLDSDFAAQLNYGMSKTKNSLVLFLDPDEEITKELSDEILSVSQNDRYINSNFSFKRIDYLWGKFLRHGEIGAYRAIRLVRKNSGLWARRVHQQFVSTNNLIELNNPILHYPHTTLHKFLDNINHWSTLHALANKEEGKNSTMSKIIFWPVIHFVKNYVFRLGFMDGMQGLICALVMAIHSYLSWSKLWMLQKGFTKI